MPDKLQITTGVGGRPAPGMLVLFKFLALKKSPFDFVFDPSDAQGKIEVSRDQILLEARKTIDLFPMDHWNIEADWNGVLRVTPMNREALARALSAIRLFRSYDSPPGYEEALRTADAILARTSKGEMTVTVECDGKEPVSVETISVAVS